MTVTVIYAHTCTIQTNKLNTKPKSKSAQRHMFLLTADTYTLISLNDVHPNPSPTRTLVTSSLQFYRYHGNPT